ESGHLSLMALQRERDLLRSEDESSGRVNDQVDRHVRRGEPYRAEHLLGILDVDVARDREPQKAHRLLAMDHRDESRPPALLECVELPVPLKSEHLLLVQGNEELGEDEEPEEPGKIRHVDRMRFSCVCRLPYRDAAWRSRAASSSTSVGRSFTGRTGTPAPMRSGRLRTITSSRSSPIVGGRHGMRT